MKKIINLVFTLLVTLLVGNIYVNAEVKTIKLDADRTDAIAVNKDEEVVIDLNGKTLTVNGHAIVVDEGGKVTITGNGVVNATKAAIFNKGGEVIVENGTFTSSAWYTIKNLGTMTINGGKFGQTDEKNTSNASLIANGWYGDAAIDGYVVAPNMEDVKEAKAIMTINGGEFNHFTTTSTIKSDDWSKTTINGGKFTSKNGTLIQVTGEVIVTGGNFLGYNGIAMLYGEGVKDFHPGFEPAILKVSGGTFSAKYIITALSPYGSVTITDGTFKDIKSFTNTEKDNKEFSCTIKGGKYALDVKEYVADGYLSNKATDGYVVALPTKEVETPVVDTKKEVEEITVGVTDSKKVTEVFEKALESFMKDKNITNTNVVVDLKISNTKDENVDKKVVENMTKKLTEKVKDAKVAGYFEITLNVLNKDTNATLGTLSEFDEKVTLQVLIPKDVKEIKEGYKRTYYIIRNHGDNEVTVLDTKVSEDGNSLSFETDRFSTYALAYKDELIETPKVEEITSPKTGDTIITTIAVFGGASLVLGGLYLYSRKHKLFN